VKEEEILKTIGRAEMVALGKDVKKTRMFKMAFEYYEGDI
jgi:hypothetical protein